MNNCSFLMDENSIMIGVQKGQRKQDIQKSLKKRKEFEENQQRFQSSQQFTDQWMIQSNNQAHMRNDNSGFMLDGNCLGDGSEIVFKSIGSEKSQMEYNLREENMKLRQEILKLKKALFINNPEQPTKSTVKNQILDSNDFLTPQQMSPSYFNPSDTPNDSEYVRPFKQPPQPYASRPDKPTISTRQNSEILISRDPRNQIQQSQTDFRFNLFQQSQDQTLRNSQTPSSNSALIDYLTNDNNHNQTLTVDGRDPSKIHQDYSKLQSSIDTTKPKSHYKRQLSKLTDKSPNESIDNSQHLKLQNRRQDTLSKIIECEALLNMQSSNDSLLIDDSQELQLFEQQLRAENIHVRQDFMQDQNKNGFQERKKMSSVLEIKRHYELEIENLKRDLETMQKEESKIKSKIDKQNYPLNRNATMNSNKMNQAIKQEFTFKKEGLQILQQNNQLTAETNQSFSLSDNSQRSLKKETEISQQSLMNIKNKKQYGQNLKKQSANKHQRYLSIDKLNDQTQFIREDFNTKLQESQNQWQPPSFSNSHINTIQNSPSNKQKEQQNNISQFQDYSRSLIEKHVVESQNESQNFDSFIKKDFLLKNDMTEDQRLDTEIIDQIFEDKQLQQQFVNLDSNSNLVIQDSFQDQRQSQTDSNQFGSFQENSFCYHINVKSEQSSIAVVRAQEKVRAERLREQSNGGTNMVFNMKNSISELIQPFQQESLTYDDPKNSCDYFQAESPLKRENTVIRKKHPKDCSPSFGGPKAFAQIYEIQETPDDAIFQNNQIFDKPSKKSFHSKQPSYTQKQLTYCSSQSVISNQQQNSSRPQSTNKSCNTSLASGSTINSQQVRLNKIMKSVACHHKRKSSDQTYAFMKNQQQNLNQSSFTNNFNSNNEKKKHLLGTSKSQISLKMTQKQQNINTCNSQNQTMIQSRSQLHFTREQNQNTSSISNITQIMNQSNYNSRGQNKSQQKVCSRVKEYIPNDNNQEDNSMLDAEILYDIRIQGALKRRTEIMQKKEDLNRTKLNEKMARIQLIQQQKQDKRNEILEKRLSKSPVSQTSRGNNSSMLSKYVSVPNGQISQRIPISTPKMNEYSRNEELNDSIFQTVINQSSMVLSKDKSPMHSANRSKETSLSASRVTSKKGTQKNTPLVSSRINYNTNTNTNSQVRQFNQQKLFEKRKTSNNKFDENETGKQFVNSYSTEWKYNLQSKSNNTSTSNLFKKNPQKLIQNQSSRVESSHLIKQNMRNQIDQITTKLQEKIQSSILNMTNTTPGKKYTSVLSSKKHSNQSSAIKSGRKDQAKTTSRINKSNINHNNRANEVIMNYCQDFQAYSNSSVILNSSNSQQMLNMDSRRGSQSSLHQKYQRPGTSNKNYVQQSEIMHNRSVINNNLASIQEGLF